MKNALRFIIPIIAIFAIAQISYSPLAQAQAQGVKQIQLSKKHIQNGGAQSITASCAGFAKLVDHVILNLDIKRFTGDDPRRTTR